MKKYFLLFVISLGIMYAQSPGDSVFAGIKVHTINLQFNQPNYWDSLTYYYSQGYEQYILASATLNGVLFDSIGVRLKGNASYGHPNNKKSFKLGFGEYNGSLKWDGLKSVHLNNCWGDPTFMREKLHLDFCRDAGIPAPRGNFAAVYLNGTFWGLYSMEESVDKRFLANHYPVTTGNLYKAVDAIGTTSTYVSDFLWYGSDSLEYKNRYELKTDEPVNQWSDLIKLIDTLNNAQSILTVLPNLFSLSSLYKAMAADNIFGNVDSYIGSGRNFYVYNLSEQAYFTWIVWDAGLSLGAYTNSPASVEQMSVTYLSDASQRPLAAKVFNTPVFKQAYLGEICKLSNTLFTTARLYGKIDSIAALIRQYVYADTKKMYTTLQFENNLSSDITPTGAKRIPGLKSFINLRKNSILAQLQALSVSCTSTIEAGDIVINEFLAQNDSIPDPAGEFEDWIELYNNTTDTLELSGMYMTDDYTNLYKWTIPAGSKILPHGYFLIWVDEDSGQVGTHAMFKLSAGGEQIALTNSDGLLIDSIKFGAQTLNLSMARIPDGTGSFFQSLPTINNSNGTSIIIPVGTLVINEVMPDNTTITDPAGETEPWLELYNVSGSILDISGLFLSDDYTNIKKWKFPAATSINPKSYIVVWTDGDTTQSGIHTSFTLPVSNGKLILSNANSTRIDSVSYGIVTTNKSYSRIPNGSGGFSITAATPGFANSISGGIIPGEVVINEFAADNDSITDPAGETDDWIEIYNNSQRAIDLSGIYLSDSYTNPVKWAFPSSTSIQPNSYIIVWADQDTGQVGIHALFALSASGEKIILSNKDLSVIDSVSYAIQTTNKSMARRPNGTGSFISGNPTFGFNNDSTLSTAPEIQSAGYALQQNYPNPFNPSTKISYSIPSSGNVQLAIYNMMGEEIIRLKNEFQQAGSHSIAWNGRNEAGNFVPSGIYLYRINVNSFSQIKKMILLK